VQDLLERIMRRTGWTGAAISGLCVAVGVVLGQTTQRAEMVSNGDFEAAAQGPAIPHWTEVREGAAEGAISLDAGADAGGTASHGLKMAVAKVGERLGEANSGPAMSVRDGQWYDGAFMAQTLGQAGAPAAHIGLLFSLESDDGKRILARTTIPEIGGPWKRYPFALQARGTDAHARLVISLIEPCTMWLDDVSMMPREK
jgi:hypothetical protein